MRCYLTYKYQGKKILTYTKLENVKKGLNYIWFMFGDRNDTRFWIFHSTIGKWIVRIFIIVVLISALLKYLGYVD